MKTITIEVPDETKYITSAIVVGSGEESKPIFFDFNTNLFSGAKINENGEVAYMIRLEKKEDKRMNINFDKLFHVEHTTKKEENMTPNKNYIDERGNYHNIENLTLAQIYDRGVEEGCRIAKMEQEDKKNDG